MKLRNIWLLELLLCLSAVGCESKSAERPMQNVTRLKEMLKRTDVVLIKHFYPMKVQSEDSDTKFPQIIPGSISATPVWAYEPTEKSNGLTGVILEVRESYLLDLNASKNGGQKDQAVLDLDELRDLDNALTAMQSENAPWRATSSAEDIEMMFAARDGFSVTAIKKTDGESALLVKAGAASIDLNYSKAPAFQADVRSAISLLESKTR